jgi:hypothetical protein
VSYGDLLNSDEFKRTDVIFIILQTKLNDLTYTLHECVESLGPAVTTAEGKNSGNVITFFVLLDHYGEFSLGLHARTLMQDVLARRVQAIGVKSLTSGIPEGEFVKAGPYKKREGRSNSALKYQG